MDPNFFQAKLAMTKAFPEKRLTLGKIHSLYQEIYTNKPKASLSPTNKADRMSILLNHGESAVYVDEDMKKLLQRFIPSDEDIKFFTKGAVKKSKFKDVSKMSLDRKDSNISYPLHKSSSEVTLFPQSEIEKVEVSDYIVPISPDTTFAANSRRASPKERKMHPSVQLLKKNIERYSIVSKTSGKFSEMVSLNDSTPHKSDHDPDVYIKGFRRRVGLEHNKSAVAEYGDLVKQVQHVDQQEPLSTDKLQNINNKNTKKHYRSSYGLSIDVGMSSFHDKKRDGMSVLVGSQSTTATGAKVLNLPTISKSAAPARFGVANEPKMIKRRNYHSKEVINQLFDSCSKVKENINNIDRKLSHDGKKNTKKLANLRNRLRKVMKINFLPPEFILEDDI